jgi:plasmid replication initiation protein
LLLFLIAMPKKKKKILPPSSLVVTQSNQLVEARYNLPLSEQRLILTMIARIQPEDEDFKPYKIPIKEFAEFMGIDPNSAYRECKKITKTLLTRVIEIKEPGRLLQTGWVSSAEYINGTGMVNLCFDPLLKPYLTSLKGNFTSLKLEMILSFKSQYTMRIYSLLKQYEGFKNYREIAIDNLRDMLGLMNDQHKEYSNLKANILKPVQKELLEKADLFFEMDEIKFGRRVAALRFKIYFREIPPKTIKNNPESDGAFHKSDIGIQVENNECTALLLLVPKQHQTKKTIVTAITQYFKKHGFQYVERNILYTNLKADKSYAGFLGNSLKNDWGQDWHENQDKTVKALTVWEKQGFKSQQEYDDHMYRVQMKNYGVLT